LTGSIFAQPLDFRGQVSLWAQADRDAQEKVGWRYVPTLSWSAWGRNGRELDVELSGRLQSFAPTSDLEPLIDDWHGRLYRGWLRWQSPRLEIRAGLQSIEFGPAQLLRSERWFDRLDPRDPLKLTDGVKAVLGRYTFLNNANIWLWGLYDNDELKGWEIQASDPDEVEWGGRFQAPLWQGEVAVSTHRRSLAGSGRR